MEAFVSILSDKLGSFFDLTFHNLCPNKRSPIFGEPGAVAPVDWRVLGDGLEEEAGHWGPGRKGPLGKPGEDQAFGICPLLPRPRGLPAGAQGVRGPDGSDGPEDSHGDGTQRVQPVTRCRANAAGALPRGHRTQ